MERDLSNECAHLPQVPEQPAIDLEQFRVHSRLDIERIVRDLVQNREPITVYYNKKDSVITTLLGVEPQAGRIFLAEPIDDVANRRLLAAEQLVLVSRHDQVRIQFATNTATRAIYKGASALMVQCPDTLLRMQRREFVRLTTPVVMRPRCAFTCEDGSVVETHVVDISIGGIGIAEPDPGIHESVWEIGRVFKACRIDLPDGRVISDLEVRNCHTLTLPNGQTHLRVGFKFSSLAPQMHAAIQRYIEQIERERRRPMQD